MNRELINHIINIEVEKMLNTLAKSDEILKQEGAYYLIGYLKATIELTANKLKQITDEKSN